MEKHGKIPENYEVDLENLAFHYTGHYSMIYTGHHSIMHLLPCFHGISPTFCVKILVSYLYQQK